MKIKHIILRYINIIGRLSNNKRATFDQIQSHLQNQMDASYSEETLRFSRRTFQREIKEIEELFEVSIKCDKSGQYFIAEDFQSNERLRFIQNLNFLNYEKHFEKFNKHIIYDHSCVVGSDFLYDLQNAISSSRRILMNYRKFNQKSTPNHLRKLEPYGLKEYKNRWYLIANDPYIEDIRVFGLDRIQELMVLDEIFRMPPQFNLNELFKYSAGISFNKDPEIDIVELKLSPRFGNYVKSVPLHSSQTILEDTDECCRIRLKLEVNDEFVNEIMYLMHEGSVVKPLSLKNKIRLRAQQILDQNNTV